MLGSNSQGKSSNSESTAKDCSNINVPIETLKYHSQFGELHSNYCRESGSSLFGSGFLTPTNLMISATDLTNNNCALKELKKIGYSYEIIQSIANFLLERVKSRPKIGIICGSGLGPLGDQLVDSQCFQYEDIPHFPVSTVKGHAGRLIFGMLDNIEVMCLQGRFHCYEGYPLWKCAMPVRLMKIIGITHLIVTNAAGGLNANFKVGDIMIIKDHINIMGFAGNSALNGPNDERFGPRFPAINRAYDPEIRKYAKDLALKLGTLGTVHEGIYACLGGPNYETIAELRMLRNNGVDAVGMSTIPEVITAKHCGMTVFAFSLITNSCVLEYEDKEEANHEEVVEIGKKKESVLIKFVSNIVHKIHKDITA